MERSMIVSHDEVSFYAEHTLPSELSRHGHTFRVRAWVEGPLDPRFGWVIDFAVLRRIVWEEASPLPDTLLNATITVPTAENVAAWIAARIEKRLPAGVSLVKLRLAEDANEVEWAPEPATGPWSWRPTKLGYLNRVLRWIGFVLVRHVEHGKTDRFVLTWVGLPPDRAWARHCERTRSARQAERGGTGSIEC